jgi:hypothetical protein
MNMNNFIQKQAHIVILKSYLILGPYVEYLWILLK